MKIENLLENINEHNTNSKKYNGYVLESLVEIDCFLKVILSNQAFILSKINNNEVDAKIIENELIDVVNELKSQKLIDVINYLSK